MIANAEAGSAVDDAVATVERVLSGAASVEVVRPDGPDELEQVLADRRGREVVVLGGDGSLHLVVATLHRTGELASTVLGLVPMGTGNDFARTLELPLDPAEAAQRVLNGTPRAFDLLVDDRGGVVVNAAHVGVGAEAGKEAKELKPRLGKLAYAAGAAKAGAKVEGWHVEVVVDGETVTTADEPVLMVGIGNGRSVGGGTRLAPGAEPDDGMVDVVVSHALGPVARLAYAAQMALGRHEQRDDVTALRGRVITVRGEAMPVNTDGELEDDVTARTWTVHPAAWHLRQ